MRGATKILSDSEIGQIHESAVALLVSAGMKVCHPGILQSLEKTGAKVDGPRQRAILTREMIARLLPEHPTNITDWELNTKSSQEGHIWGSHPFILDWPQCTARKAARKDLTEVLQAAHGIQEIGIIGPPISMDDVPASVEPIEAMALTMSTTDKKLHHAEIVLHEQIKYAVEFGEILTGQPRSAALVPENEYFTSPLVFGDRSAECVLEKIRLGIPVRVGTMSTSGLNSPGTVAGTVVLGLAELLGGLVMFKAIEPNGQYGCIACTGVMDMTTADACFSTPECTLQNMAIYQILRLRYGIHTVVAQQYVDATLPGIQATFEKTHRYCATAGFGAHLLPNNGILKSGLVFSPEQCLLDLEMSRALARQFRGMVADDDAMALDLLISACHEASPNFLAEEHTVRHCRQNFWLPKLPLRARDHGTSDWYAGDERLLQVAHERWNEAQRNYHPIDLAEDKRRAINDVVARARRELIH
jgi:trimethylamine--corrinoid protein Co-methyltransferase